VSYIVSDFISGFGFVRSNLFHCERCGRSDRSRGFQEHHLETEVMAAPNHPNVACQGSTVPLSLLSPNGRKVELNGEIP